MAAIQVPFPFLAASGDTRAGSSHSTREAVSFATVNPCVARGTAPRRRQTAHWVEAARTVYFVRLALSVSNRGRRLGVVETIT
jgi:hypothetical protein